MGISSLRRHYPTKEDRVPARPPTSVAWEAHEAALMALRKEYEARLSAANALADKRAAENEAIVAESNALVLRVRGLEADVAKAQQAERATAKHKAR